ncbi:MAG: type II secretion system F family protein [Chromatiales bacterium]|nr:type II secretion system F family protein [Chromatiales bacterium]
MFAWRIQLVGGTGKLQEVVVRGISFKHAISTAGYELAQIVGVKRCLNYDWLTTRVSAQVQMIFLMKLMPYYISGIPDQSSRLFRTYAPIKHLTRRNPLALDVNLSLSERLEALAFNPIVVAVIRAGEKSGQIAAVLKQAISSLHKEIETKRTASKGIIGGLMLLIASLVILSGVSLGTSGALTSLIEAGIIEQYNVAGLVLNAIGTYTRDYLWSLFLIVAAIVGVFLKYGDNLKQLWPISIFDRYPRVVRSIRLISVWLILERAGLSIEHDEQLLSTAIGKKHAEYISNQRQSGETFSDLLNSQYFSKTLAECCMGIAALTTSNRVHLLEQIAQLLDIERAQLATTISRTFYIIGMIITLSAIALILSGVLLPIYSSGLSGVQL